MNRKSIFLALGLLVGLTQIKPADGETLEDFMKKMNVSKPTLLEKITGNPLTSTACAASVAGGAYWFSQGKYERESYPGALQGEIDMIKGSRFNTLKTLAKEHFDSTRRWVEGNTQMAAIMGLSFFPLVLNHRTTLCKALGIYSALRLFERRLYIQSQREEIDKQLQDPRYAKPSARKKTRWVGPVPEEINNFLKLLVHHPQEMHKFNIDAPSGFLLHGKPGTGKTFLVTHLAETLNVPLIKKSSADLVSAIHGETERNIEKLLNTAITMRMNAGKQLCIVFIDEIEGLVGDREQAQAQLETRATNIFLQIIEKGSKNGVLFIGATNYPNKIDAAIKRSGRLKPIEVDIPNSKERTELFKWYFNNHKIGTQQEASSKQLQEWATHSAGFTRADIKGAIETAVAEAANSRTSTLEERSISKAIKVFEKNKKTKTLKPWIGKLPKEIDATLTLIKRAKRAREHSISAPAGFFLYGKPGNGKTLAGKEIARRLNTEYIFQNGTELEDKWIGGSAKKIVELFKKALKRKKDLGKDYIVVIIDEADTIMCDRNAQTYSGGHGTGSTQTFLSQIEEAAESGIIIVATTNHIAKIDSAILRSGRLQSIEIADPTKDDITELLETYLRHHNFTEFAAEAFDKIVPKPKGILTKLTYESPQKVAAEKAKKVAINIAVQEHAKEIFAIEDVCRADVAAIVKRAALKSILENDQFARLTLQHLKDAISEFKTEQANKKEKEMPRAARDMYR